MSVEAQLKQSSNISDKDEKISSYKLILDSLFKLADDKSSSEKVSSGLKEFVSHVVEAPQIVSRPLLKEFVTGMKGVHDADLHKDIAKRVLEILGKHTVQFEEIIADIRYRLAKVLIEEGEYITAATTLQEIPLDQRVYPPEFKAKVWVMIAQLYLQEERSLEAKRWIDKAAPLMGQIKKEKLVARYKSAFVKNQDFNRKFAEAALGYYRLSQQVPEKERIEVLEHGVRCCVLAPAGPQQSRLLAMYYKDEKAQQLGSYTVLEKMFMERILKKDEIKAFEESLLGHQKAVMAGGKTILEQAVIEHNLLAASKVYNNITFDELAVMLDVTPEMAEKIASRMIAEERLTGSINQIARLLNFNKNSTSNELTNWDSHIEHACSSINNIIERIGKKYPEFVKANHW
eukprot:TRINITY_DN3839_c0_g1_i1.p1 TRINITY_DN3839_c0_g1~~TRINITY_DN3839_c0_g1_i1.p1  ORF type:complete len:402 (-),score=122.50 TRINITY_DN3839_c0_g1_i1:50-1255(-)